MTTETSGSVMDVVKLVFDSPTYPGRDSIDLPHELPVKKFQ